MKLHAGIVPPAEGLLERVGRDFRTELPLATISDRDPGSVRRAVTVLCDHRGPDWRAEDVVLLRESLDATPPRYHEFARLPLADK